MDISQRTVRSVLNEDQRWLGKQHGVEAADTITLARSLFDLTTIFPNGYIPSGIALGKATSGGSSGLYGPYASRANEIQTVGLGAASAGTVTITVDGAVTGNIAFNATTAAVQAALDALPNVSPGDIVASGGPFPGVITLAFGGRFAGVNMEPVTVTPTGLTGGTVTVTTTTAGGTAVTDGRQTLRGHLLTSIAYDRASTANLGAALFVHGEVLESRLPANHGLDAAGKADVVGSIRYV